MKLQRSIPRSIGDNYVAADILETYMFSQASPEEVEGTWNIFYGDIANKYVHETLPLNNSADSWMIAGGYTLIRVPDLTNEKAIIVAQLPLWDDGNISDSMFDERQVYARHNISAITERAIKALLGDITGQQFFDYIRNTHNYVDRGFAEWQGATTDYGKKFYIAVTDSKTSDFDIIICD